jgi:ATP-dependent RNA helicase DDX31/DBP7
MSLEDIVNGMDGGSIGLNIVVADADKPAVQSNKRKLNKHEKKQNKYAVKKQKRKEKWQKTHGESEEAEEVVSKSSNLAPEEKSRNKEGMNMIDPQPKTPALSQGEHQIENEEKAKKEASLNGESQISNEGNAKKENPSDVIVSNQIDSETAMDEGEKEQKESPREAALPVLRVEENEAESTKANAQQITSNNDDGIQIKPSRNEARKNKDFLQNDDARAEYMAQYHARPMELDRRSKAAFRIKPSEASNSIFAEADKVRTDEHGSDSAPEKQTSSNNAWEKMGLHSSLVNAICNRGIVGGAGKSAPRPTIVQSDAIPKLLIQKPCGSVNVCVQCETGSGKTLAYLLPVVHAIAMKCEGEKGLAKDRNALGTQCIIMCPTRELATQTLVMATKLLQHSFSYIVPGCLSGGEKRKAEKAKLRKGVTVLIATPGRLLDHLAKTECLALSLKGKISWLVLDEVDRLLDMGHKNQIQEIVERVRVLGHKVDSRKNEAFNTFNSVLVSATVTPSTEALAESILGDKNNFIWSKPSARRQKGREDDGSAAQEYSVGVPQQLSQHFMVVNAKMRLPALVSFLVARVKKKDRVIIFFSTCDSVDFYHKLFTSMESMLSEDEREGAGIFGSAASLYRLHGNIAHAERQSVLKELTTEAASGKRGNKASILLATDVAARGLNLLSVDWIVQYDPPCEISDYVHRAGRAARAGNAGHALLFLLPSEQEYVDVLKTKGLADVSALSLAATLAAASHACPDITKEGQIKTGSHAKGRSGEAFSAGVQDRCEQFIMKQIKLPVAGEDGKTSKKKKKEKEESEILIMARQAFASYIRAYPTKEKIVRHIFCARALHLGHIARSFGLKEPPSMAHRASRKANNNAKDGKAHSSQLGFKKRSEETKNSKGGQAKKKSLAEDDELRSGTNIKGNRLAMMNAARRHIADTSEFG